jgi:hypothetical protein
MKQAVYMLGTLMVLMVVAALIVPKAVHAVVATLVQVVGNVAVVNPSNGIPLVNRDVDNGPRQGLIMVARSGFGPGTSYGGGIYAFPFTLLDGTTYTIPSGQRFVVEYISGYMDLSSSSGSAVVGTSLDSSITASPNTIYQLELSLPQLTSPTASNNAVYNHLVFAQPLRAYVDSNGTSVFVRTLGDQSAAGGFSATLVGYLVNCAGGCPPQP